MRWYLSPFLRYARHHQQGGRKTTFTTVAVAAAASSGLWFLTVMKNPPTKGIIRCDSDDDDNHEHKNKEDDFPVELYPNMPDEDVDTSCKFCRAYRQGPCRDFWRNFEYSYQDHLETKTLKEQATDDKNGNGDKKNEEDDGGTSHSSEKYLEKFIGCKAEYEEFYAVALAQVVDELYHDEVSRELERAALPAPTPVNIEWSSLIQYYNDTSTVLEDLNNTPDDASSSSSNDDTPKEKNLHPNLVDFFVEFEDEESLVDTYVRDQDGNLLPGRDHLGILHEKPWMIFMVEPSKTKEVTVYKVYRKEDNTEVIFKSGPVSLLDVAREGGIPMSH